MRKSPRQSPTAAILQPGGTSRSSGRPAAFLWEAWPTAPPTSGMFKKREDVEDLRKSDLHTAACKLHRRRKRRENPCQRRIQPILGNQSSLGWSPGRRQQDPPLLVLHSLAL